MNSSHINIFLCFAGEEIGTEKGGASCFLSAEAHCEVHVRSWVDAKGAGSGSFRYFSNCRIPSTTVAVPGLRLAVGWALEVEFTPTVATLLSR